MEELGRRFSWASLPLVATISRLLCREQTLQVAYLWKGVWTFCGLRRRVTAHRVFGPYAFFVNGHRAWSGLPAERM